ncbi:MAG TPA: GNAT family N-acetyltransferase [Candidatus Binatia bacterium]|nr:GNAT family N-acetyltransferase [Candidatus Binatia bacterium]
MIGEEEFLEKAFYLDEFHEKTLLLAIAPGGVEETDLAGFLATARELIRAEVRLVVVADADMARRLESRFRRLAAASVSEPLFADEDPARRPTIVVEAQEREPDRASLLRLWSLLRAGPIAVARIPDASWIALASYAAKLAARLKVHKLVLVDPEGGVGSDGAMSFLDENVLATLLGAGEAEWVGLGHRRPLIQVIRDGLLAGIPSINLCALGGLARELYTYEGSGTLFTLEDYCRVEPLGIDDFREVERLLERGQREGFLKIRSREEIGEILFTGFGATIASGHLAGVGSLLCDRYRPHRTGEVVALYTVSRFKGEGVGAKLLDRILAEARGRELATVFACTTEERAVQFFARHGFQLVTPADVPAAKWIGYDCERMQRVAVLRRELEA